MCCIPIYCFCLFNGTQMALINSANGLLLSSKTPVSSLQEMLLRSNITPEYELIYNGVGTHDPIFKYQLTAGSVTGNIID